MAIEIESLLSEVSPEAPCGEDISYDNVFLALEGMLRIQSAGGVVAGGWGRLLPGTGAARGALARLVDAAEAARHNLTVAEVYAARRTGTPPERYAAMKDVRSIDDYMKATTRLQGG